MSTALENSETPTSREGLGESQRDVTCNRDWRAVLEQRTCEKFRRHPPTSPAKTTILAHHQLNSLEQTQTIRKNFETSSVGGVQSRCQVQLTHERVGHHPPTNYPTNPCRTYLPNEAPFFAIIARLHHTDLFFFSFFFKQQLHSHVTTEKKNLNCKEQPTCHSPVKLRTTRPNRAQTHLARQESPPFDETTKALAQETDSNLIHLLRQNWKADLAIVEERPELGTLPTTRRTQSLHCSTCRRSRQRPPPSGTVHWTTVYGISPLSLPERV